MTSLFERIYTPLPIPAQEALLSARGVARERLRGQRLYRRLLAGLEQTQYADEDALRALQLRRLGVVLGYAMRHVPYYRDQASGQGSASNPVAADPVAALQRFGLLDKGQVMASAKDLVSEAANWRYLAAGYSSGTTGAPITVYRNLYSINVEAAMLARQWAWAGVARHQPRATLRGQLIMPATATQPPYWRYNRAENQLLMSSYHLSAANAPHYIAELLRYRPVVLEGYPSSLYALALLGQEHGVDRLRGHIRAAITSSETLGDQQRSVIEETFGCRVFDYFGNAERTIFIGTCEQGSYHLCSDYGWTEFLPPQDDQGPDEALPVCTPFHNLAMPLLRYVSDDVLVRGQRTCPCGRAFPIIERIIGRNDDYVLTPDGRLIGRLDTAYKGLTGILQSEIVQDGPQHITIKLTPGPLYTPASQVELVRRLHQLLGMEIELEVQHVQEIPRAAAGKRRLVRSLIRERAPLPQPPR